ncbi:hypothetical protein HOY82DRAFT_468326, partial [Tuber indicum]
YCLPLFIPDFILRILSNPASFRCALVFINSVTLQKSSKSLDFTPTILYLLKKGIIFSVRSENL